MLCVLLAEYGVFGRYLPVDAQAIVKDADAAVGLGMIEFVTLVLEHRRFTQNGKAMGKTFWDEKLPMVVIGQFHGDMFAVGGRTFAYVNGNIEHSAPHASHQFCLRERRTLEMQTVHHTV